MLIKKTASFLLCCFFILGGATALHAEWVEDGNAVRIGTGTQYSPDMASDGAGGVIVTWYENRTANWDIYAQLMDAWGRRIWVPDGIRLCSEAHEQKDPVIASDGAGGAIIAWLDLRNGTDYDVYAQLVDAGGAAQWTANGVAVCTATECQYTPAITSDGAGGAVITWEDRRNGAANSDIYAQRIDASGAVLWGTDGVAVCTDLAGQVTPQLVSDGSGGAIITWADLRSAFWDIYAQRIDSNGNAVWSIDGDPICTAVNSQTSCQIVPDGSGGAVITWRDFRNFTNMDIYVQRVDGGGSIFWTVDGNAVCTDASIQSEPQIMENGAGYWIITWHDDRGADNDIYAQRVDGSGTMLWTTDGIAVCTASYDQTSPCIVHDGLGGAVITWVDLRCGTGTSDIYTQQIDASGAAQWTVDGIALCTEVEDQFDLCMATDGAGGAIAAWTDQRTGSPDIYAQRIERNGYWGCPSPYIYAARDIPGDQGGSVNLSWNASRLDPWPYESISHYTVWRAIDPDGAALEMNRGARLLTSAADIVKEADVFTILEQQILGETYFWYLIGTIDAYYLPTYSMPAPTLFDSTASSTEYHYFQVIAHTSLPSEYWISPPDSGYSVDNLSPCAPLGLAGLQSYVPEGLTLTWDPSIETDLDCYRVYRGASEGFTPDQGNLIASPCDTTTFDDVWRWDGGYHYKVAAVDIHGNESGYALLGPEGVTGEDTPDAPRRDFLAQNYPNPFNPVTSIRFGLKRPAHVRIAIYDTAGRLVRTLLDERRSIGPHTVEWNGTDAFGREAASGVYFYSIKAGPFKETKKMLVLR